MRSLPVLYSITNTHTNPDSLPGFSFLRPSAVMVNFANRFPGFVRHWISARSRFRIHSPFVYDFVSSVLPHRLSPEGNRISGLRRIFLQRTESIPIQDFGAGYGGYKQAKTSKSLAEIARSSARKRRSGELMFRILRHYHPQNCLELGTNMGFSALYQMSGFPDAKFTTVEGSGTLAEIARSNFKSFGFDPRIILSGFLPAIDELSASGEKFDFILLDGHHEQDATIKYFQNLIPICNPGACIVIDDINWSGGMRKAWKKISAMEEVSVKMDLYSMGICFVKRPQAKESFKLRFWG